MADVDVEDDARYVYGVIAAADAPRAAAHLATVTGVASAPPTVLMLGSVADVVSAHPGGPLRRTDAVWLDCDLRGGFVRPHCRPPSPSRRSAGSI